jgi:signal transduction histidine kinase
MKRKLRDKFILFFIVLACVPVLVLGATTLYLVDLVHRQDVSKLELQLISEKTSEVEKFLADTLGVLELRLEAIDKAKLEEFGITGQESLAQGILDTNSAIEEVSFVSPEGIEVVKLSREGMAIDLLHVGEVPAFKQAIAGQNFIGEIYYTLSGPMVSMASPVRVENTVAQVLVAEVNLSPLVKSIEAAQLGTSGYLILLDRNARRVSYRTYGTIRPGFDVSEWSRAERVLRGETLSGLEGDDRYESLFTKVPVVGSGKQIGATGWALLAEWPLQDADAVIRDVRNQIVLVTLASVVAVLLLAPLFAIRLVRPIRELQKSAEAIEQGKLETKVDIHTQDELEELGGAFNKMTKGLRRLEELREEFVFVAAHELRSPVTVIKGYASMILGGDAGPIKKQVRDYLKEIDRANQRLLQLVEDLLEVARSEAGRLNIEVERVDVSKPVGEAVAELVQLAREKSISLDYQKPANLPAARADERRIKEIMVNLVNNAIKYTRQGGSVKVFHEVKGQELITHVQDNGLGIAKEAQDKIFEKFYRVQTKETSDIQGTGLGLFIVKQLVEKMKGRIWFVSEKDKGSTFSFSLPKDKKKP